jgi:hypothetical protein
MEMKDTSFANLLAGLGKCTVFMLTLPHFVAKGWFMRPNNNQTNDRRY